MSVHPAWLSDEELVQVCEMRSERRGGPGGQHRNKVETAVVIEHLPTGIRAEANERRSQIANRSVALYRLRLKLALQVRGTLAEKPVDHPSPSPLWRRWIARPRLNLSPNHRDLPALLSEALDHLAAVDWNASDAADRLSVSPSRLVKLLKLYPPAFSLLNEQRKRSGLGRLR